jgi:hypothetical protein
LESKALIRSWEIAGILFISVLGTTFHFVFQLSGYWRPIGWLAAVNESVWEHLKMVFWPGLIWALVEFIALQGEARNFWAAKALSLLSMPLIIIVVHYGAPALFRGDLLFLDILVFYLAIVTGQWLSFRVLTAAPLGAAAQWAGAAAHCARVCPVHVLPTPHLPVRTHADP